MQDEKISVIVPIYKVEPYLRKCLDSIVYQTHRDLEIILVDDGSPDNCGAICDEYAAGDSRIRVIHKENGGVSSARNAGLAAATGEWIGWVDPDDWVELDMFEYLLEGAQRYDADIAVCGRVEVYPDRQVPIGWESEEVLGQEQAIGSLLKDGMLRNYLCDKLWKGDLFQNISFPEGRNFEDLATTYRIFEKAERIVCLPLCKYFYLQRPAGIVQDTSLRNIVDCYELELKRYLHIRERYPQFQRQMETALIVTAIRIWSVYLPEPPDIRRRYKEHLREMSAFVREHPTAVSAAAQAQGLAGKLMLKLVQYPFWWSFALAQGISWVYAVRHKK